MKDANRIALIEDVNMILYRQKTTIQISSHRISTNVYKAFSLLMETYASDVIFKKQCIFEILSVMPSEIRKCFDQKANEEFYNKTVYLINDTDVVFDDRFVEKKKEKIKRSSFKEQCYLNWHSHEGRLELFEEELLELLENKRIVLWGNGKRGEVFQVFCAKNQISLMYIVDKQNIDVKKTKYGFFIKHTDEVMGTDAVIVASNHIISDWLRSREYGNEILDLEDYC